MTRILFLVSLLTMSLFAAGGELALYVLKDGKPLPTQEVVIMNLSAAEAEAAKPETMTFTTDAQGYLGTILPEGNYQLQLLATEDGAPQAFVKKNFLIAADKQTQIILSLKSDKTLLFADVEAPEGNVTQRDAKQDVVKVNGTVALTLLSSEDEKPVAGARVFVPGIKINAVSDAQGHVVIDLPEGNRTLSIIHTSYSSQNVKVTVLPKEMVSRTVELSPAAMELEEFVVLAPHIEGSVAAAITEERNSDAVGNVLGSEQFSKSGDSSVAAALKRVSGITIVGGKYVYVRGLGDRYSTVMLNDLHVPSPEPTKRVVPLDIFPTSVVESITIQKSYTGDLPASFGGGTVLIKSKEIPAGNEGYASIAVEAIMNSNTGSKATTNGDNSVPLPSSALSGGNNVGGWAVTQDVLHSRSLNRESTTLPPGGKLEVAAGKSYAFSDDLSVGASGTVYYKNTSDNDKTEYNKFFYDINTGSIYHDNHTTADVTTFKEELSGMVNLGVNYLENQKFKYTFFATMQTSDKTTLSSVDYTGSSEDREKTYYEYVETGLTMHQISGSNELRFGSGTDGYFDNLKIDWAYETAEAYRDEPGTVEYNYLHQTSGLNWDRKNWYYYFILNDTVDNVRGDFTLPFEFNGNENYTKAGVFVYSKERDFDSRRFKMLSSNFSDMPEDMDTIYQKYANDLDFSASYRLTDSYRATQDVTAFYLKQLLSVTHDFDIVASVRQEDSSQQLFDAAASYAPLETSDLFPSLGATYRFDNDAMQLRFAYAKSISRPDFREFSNSRYKDPVTENIVFGNPGLNATYIDHYDLKYEWYMEADEMFSMALFAKMFDNPIEKVIKRDDSQDNTFLETYINADSATSYGVEVDLRKRFGFVSDSLSNLLFATNVALIQSEIKLPKTDATDPFYSYINTLTSKKRAMQGQSPYVVNLTFGYDNADTGDSALFLFNQIGERIVSLGTEKNKDVYEQPFAKLDFVTQWKLNNYFFKDSDLIYSVKFKAKNLLDSKLEYKQGDLTTASTTPGQEFSLQFKIAY
ncbi:carboxypeptidase-like regulatory domain-containing protein [Sulfurimonas diazotrophicus]|uniref:Carboxypeptidase-like regulatory domain-containing protein n=1 Tax=Sulfurimonas diazotrophicus TaxID=3131939 RepID=A0ABZ3HA49_9BACT